MSDSVTIQDIYNLFERSEQKFDRLFAEAEQARLKSKAEFDQRFAEAEQARLKSQAEAEQARLQSKAEFDQRMDKTEQARLKSKAEFDQRMAKLDKSIAEMTQAVKETNKQVAGLSTRWGRFVENLVQPGLENLFQARGIDVIETHRNVISRKAQAAMEIDILAVNGTEAVVVEVKSKLTQNAVEEFISKLPRFKQAFPAYKNYTIYGAIAGIEVEEQAARYGYKQGLFVIVQAGEMMQFANDEQFKPKSW